MAKKPTKYRNDTVLAKVWNLYRSGAQEIEIANTIGCQFKQVAGIIQAARETVGVEDACRKFGIAGKPANPE